MNIKTIRLILTALVCVLAARTALSSELCRDFFSPGDLITNVVASPESRAQSVIEHNLDIESHSFFSSFFEIYPGTVTPLLGLFSRKGLFVSKYLLNKIRSQESSDLTTIEIAEKTANTILSEFDLMKPDYIPSNSKLKEIGLRKSHYLSTKKLLLELPKHTHLYEKLLSAVIVKVMAELKYTRLIYSSASKCKGELQIGESIYYPTRSEFEIAPGTVRAIHGSNVVIRNRGTDYPVKMSILYRKCGGNADFETGDKVFYKSGDKSIEAKVIGYNPHKNHFAVSPTNSGELYHVRPGILIFGSRGPQGLISFSNIGANPLKRYFTGRRIKKFITESKPQNISETKILIGNLVNLPKIEPVKFNELGPGEELSFASLAQFNSQFVDEFARLESLLMEYSSVYFSGSRQLLEFIDNIIKRPKELSTLEYAQVAKFQSDREKINGEILDQINLLIEEYNTLSGILKNGVETLERAVGKIDDPLLKERVTQELSNFSELHSHIEKSLEKSRSLMTAIVGEREKFNSLKSELEREESDLTKRLQHLQDVQRLLESPPDS